MLTYNLINAKAPLYEYIYKCIKSDILSGKLKSGEKLPSKRSFAKNNGVSTITIQNAYEQLISEGYIYSLQRKGYFVAEIPYISDIPQVSEISLNIKVPNEKKNASDLSENLIAAEKFPFSVWAKILREMVSEKGRKLMISSPTGGIRELREAIAKHLYSFRSMQIDPNQIIVGAGTEYLYSLIIQLLGTDKTFCLENPGYRKIYEIYSSNGVKCKFASLDENGININSLRASKAQIAHISPTHHFPTGITMPIKRRYEVLEWSYEKEDRYIIEDDYDSEFRFSGKPIKPLQTIDRGEKVIYINTFSISLSSTIRISYMVLPAHLANQFYEKLSFYSCTVSNFEQYTLATFIDRGYFEKHINRMRIFYSRQRRAILDCIKKSKLRNYCEIIENNSGLHFLIKLKTSLNDSTIATSLLKYNVKLKPISEYFHESNNDNSHIFIINYANIDLENFKKVLELIYQVIFDHK